MATIEEIAANGTPLYIPVPGAAYSTQRLTLDGRTYTLMLAWSQLIESWHLSLFDSEEQPIACGLRVVTGWPLLRYYGSDSRLPPGEMVAQSLTTDVSPPKFDDFGIGKRVELIYFAQNQ